MIEDDLKISRAHSQPPTAGSLATFAGDVQIVAPFQGSQGARVGGATVIFAPDARTAWHVHPLGQTLIVTEGVGRVQQWGKPIVEMGVGDVVWIPPGVRHWHGASRTNGMTHIAIAEALDGKVVDWLEHVTEAQYDTAQ